MREKVTIRLTESAVGVVSTFMIVKRLVQPWTSWDAYRLGIIDDEGRKLKEPVSSAERQAWTMFDRLMWKVLRLLQKFIGKSQLLHILTAAYLIKDSVSPTVEKGRLELLSEGLTAEKQLRLFQILKEMDEAGIELIGGDLEFSILRHTAVVEGILGRYDLEGLFLEYLTPEQRAEYSKIEMTPEARKATDHFFGEGNDTIHGVLKNPEDKMGVWGLDQKSDTHKKVEKHLGKEIPSEQYHKGVMSSSTGHGTRLGKLIKDPKLRDEFASDSTRSGQKSAGFTTSTHRGTEVAGQTNKEHSWAEASCKNIEDGSNRKYLPDEIRHGTVAHFVHDDKGKEIYRSTLQPYHNDKGNTAYRLDSEYGIKHPAFTESSKNLANKLSGEPKPGTFKVHPKVYNNSGTRIMLHPNATPDHISKALGSEDREIRKIAINHPNVTSEHITKGLEDEDVNVRFGAISHPKITPEHITKALNDSNEEIRKTAIKHPNASPENITKAMGDEHSHVRRNAVRHPNATSEHIFRGLEDKDEEVRMVSARARNMQRHS
jgi:hypothetical protein